MTSPTTLPYEMDPNIPCYNVYNTGSHDLCSICFRNSVKIDSEPKIDFQHMLWNYVVIENLQGTHKKENVWKSLGLHNHYKPVAKKCSIDNHREGCQIAVVTFSEPCDAEEASQRLNGANILGGKLDAFVLGMRLQAIGYNELMYHTVKGMALGQEFVRVLNMNPGDMMTQGVRLFTAFGTLRAFVPILPRPASFGDAFACYDYFSEAYAAEILLDGVMYRDRLIQVVSKRTPKSCALLASVR